MKNRSIYTLVVGTILLTTGLTAYAEDLTQPAATTNQVNTDQIVTTGDRELNNPNQPAQPAAPPISTVQPALPQQPMEKDPNSNNQNSQQIEPNQGTNKNSADNRPIDPPKKSPGMKNFFKFNDPRKK